MTQAVARARDLHARVVEEMDRCLELARQPELLEVQAPEVSQWSVAQHLEHIGLVDRSILDQLEKTAEDELAGQGPTLRGRLFLFLNFIPRGRAKAPSFVDPREPALAEVEPKLAATRERLHAFAEDLERLASGRPLGRHHIFGALDGARWLKFISMHHRHHMAIIRDVRGDR